MRDWLRNIRLSKGYTEKQVAEAAGIKQAPYHRIETGVVHPRVSTAKRIAKFLEFPWTDFYKDVA